MQLLIMRQDKPPHFKGDIVEIRASGTPFGGLEPDAFVLVEVPGVPMADYEQHRQSWYCEAGFNLVNQDLAQDGYRLRLYAVNANGALGAVTREQVESFITKWGGSVHSVGTNEVVFDIRIYDALVSEAFWEFDVSAVHFTELSYDQNTGIHRIQADYSATGKAPTYVERYVARRAANLKDVDDFIVVSHADSVLTYDVHRSVVRRLFEERIWYWSRRMVAKRRYHVPAAVVDYIVGQGGSIVTDVSTLANYIRDKATE